ncbi:MAG TPA: GvpL/GvpF family gas vesicle protein, partial [Solirubrobacteraceae bacterium]|nr:GvpL/GvpF family gas vesicle protein [Solirubrobacteraceae bacterium]
GVVVGTGVGDRPLRGVADGSLTAIVTDHDGPAPMAAVGALEDYESTVRSLMDSRAILPAPFGRILADDEAVRAMLRRRRRDLESKLDGIRGAVELGLHARWLDGAISAPDPRSESDVAYLRDRLETRQSARRLASQLDPLTALARGIRRTLSTQPNLPVLDAYLVDRGRVGEFVALVQELGGCHDGGELVCTGPCPPYSFADGGAYPDGVLRSTS